MRVSWLRRWPSSSRRPFCCARRNDGTARPRRMDRARAGRHAHHARRRRHVRRTHAGAGGGGGATRRAAPAARPALVFSAHSPWVTEGGWFARRATLIFQEGHRLVAVSPATFRVVEHDGKTDVMRDWRLAAGDPLSVRPGDRVTVEAGSRVRFEPRKRVPGAAGPGAAWADVRVSPLVGSVAALVTLLLGAVGLVPAAGRRGFAAPATLLTVALAPACWGVYAVATLPEG